MQELASLGEKIFAARIFVQNTQVRMQDLVKGVPSFWGRKLPT